MSESTQKLVRVSASLAVISKLAKWKIWTGRFLNVLILKICAVQFSSHSCAVAALTIWNFLPLDIHCSRCLFSFCCHHKTFFFNCCSASLMLHLLQHLRFDDSMIRPLADTVLYIICIYLLTY